MVPIRTEAPIGAIGNYWAAPHTPTPRDVALLEALANTTSVAIENVQLYTDLERRIEQRTEQLRTANAELEVANRELDAFASAVSHDLRETLNVIVGFSQVLAADFHGAMPAQALRFVGDIEASGLRIHQIIEDLLRFARLSGQSLDLRSIDLGPLVGDALRECAVAYGRRDVVVGELPVVLADAPLVRQVLVNLLSNAFKFTRSTPAARIDIGAAAGSGDEAVLFVKDNGAGFDMRHASRLFTAFSRLHREDEFPGTGIGLTLVQRIVQRHGGRIWAEAEVGRGATFWFTLPTRQTSPG